MYSVLDDELQGLLSVGISVTSSTHIHGQLYVYKTPLNRNH